MELNSGHILDQARSGFFAVPAAASFTAVPRSLASSLSPSIAGALYTGAMATPLALCGVLKSVYDVALLVMFRKVPPGDRAAR